MWCRLTEMNRKNNNETFDTEKVAMPSRREREEEKKLYPKRMKRKQTNDETERTKKEYPMHEYAKYFRIFHLNEKKKAKHKLGCEWNTAIRAATAAPTNFRWMNEDESQITWLGNAKIKIFKRPVTVMLSAQFRSGFCLALRPPPPPLTYLSGCKT